MLQDRRIESSEVDVTTDLGHPVDGSQDDLIWKLLFDKYAPKGELGASEFVDMCRDTKVINQKFTSTGARLVFNRTKAVCLAPSSDSKYREGLIFKKRVSYFVFRGVLVPLLLQRRKIEMNDFTALVSKFLARNPKIVQKQKTFDVVLACF